jgi:thiamine pyrophosphokinase
MVKEFPVAKDHTDLQLLLKELPPDRLYLCSGVWGGRFDHLYSAMHSLRPWCSKDSCRCSGADERELMVMLPAGKKCVLPRRRKKRPQAFRCLPVSGNE